MDEYDDGGLPSVDDLTVVAEIAAAELRQLEKIQAAVGASELRRRLESQQRNPGAAKGSKSNDGQDDGVPGVRKVRHSSYMPHSVCRLSSPRRKRWQRHAGYRHASTVFYSRHIAAYTRLYTYPARKLASVRLSLNNTQTGHDIPSFLFL